jgi:hypothetical protein
MLKSTGVTIGILSRVSDFIFSISVIGCKTLARVLAKSDPMKSCHWFMTYSNTGLQAEKPEHGRNQRGQK